MGYIKGDCFKGIVSGTTAKGAKVTLEGTGDRAFCRCNLTPGDIASFTVLGWRTDAHGTSVQLELDNVISYGDNVVGYGKNDSCFDAAA